MVTLAIISPSDPQWKDADSAHFLAFVVNRVPARGGRIVNLDVTIICEHLKLARIVTQCASALPPLRLPVDRVSVKATTSEQLGFTGRDEGIAAQATPASPCR